MRPDTATDPDAPLGQRIIRARELVTEHAILTGAQRSEVARSLVAALDEIRDLAGKTEALERDLTDTRTGWDTALNLTEQACHQRDQAETTIRALVGQPNGDDPTTTRADDATLAEQRADMVRTLNATTSPAEAIGITVGAASACWENLRGAGLFESDRAKMLVDVLTEHIAERQNPDLSDYLDAAHGLICNAHRATVDHVTEADGASPGWAEAARRWIDAYPPTLTAPAAGHAEFAAEARRLTAQSEQRARDHLTEQLAQRDAEITKRRWRNRELRADVDALEAERDKAVDDLERAEDQLAHIRAVLDPDTWHNYDQERAELADQLANTPGPRPATPTRPRPPATTGDATATVDDIGRAIGHSPSLHMLGVCPCQAGTPFDPDYTEADLDDQGDQ